MNTTKQEINHFLSRSFFAVLSYNDNDILQTKLMIFGHNEKGVFYLYQQRNAEEFDALKEQQKVGLLIYKEEERLEDICHVSIDGAGELIDDINSEEATAALNLIGVKSPLIKNLAEQNDRSGFTLIKVDASTMTFQSFKDLEAGLAPTILRKS